MLAIESKNFGQLPDGRDVTLFQLRNSNGIIVELLDYGSIIRAIHTPDKDGYIDDIVLGFNNLDGYVQDKNYLGAFIGRYANRIEDAFFEIDGNRFDLSMNEGQNSHHGGEKGLNKMLWDASVTENKLNLGIISPDGDQGFPGELQIQLTYELTEDNELRIDMSATSNKKTVVSFTQHPYFNLGGINLPDLAEHQLQISADHYLPINEMFIPTGELSPVGNSPFDFRSINDINSKLGDDHPQLIRAKGFDHCFVKTGVDELFAHLVHAKNGRSLRVFSNAPGLQLYTSNFLNGPYPGKHGKIYKPRQAICLEPQAFPNAPRESNFPAAVLGVNEKYEHHMVYKFGVVDV